MESGFTVAPFVGAWIEIIFRQPLPHRDPVAPFVGAWIEMLVVATPHRYMASLPSWERGLKSVFTHKEMIPCTVAPFVGAWIEISNPATISNPICVAPFVGAWIEIPISERSCPRRSSLPSWERGLKFGLP